jgi:hypothetical protein
MKNMLITSWKWELNLRGKQGKKKGFVNLGTEIKYLRIAPKGEF